MMLMLAVQFSAKTNMRVGQVSPQCVFLSTNLATAFSGYPSIVRHLGEQQHLRLIISLLRRRIIFIYPLVSATAIHKHSALAIAMQW
ncbi:hypothetical protein SERLA73DRAFT_191643 [Serpula lacrymans var. lacrymans S7.3]|uniref:Uncharacterized protein n=2 Tax=Serpula lacrymans var. lacrymans TaxID=341189 RepID=F8QI04_SERL3|nr:uncharacterized protein SERLADRAFT_459629 [Serpula lacrymans var. lacrymans S7.9]EGN92067.1 hypothetical protein SERLA73DRAFT_191643 [Serpula lacrymans var. lacrymans S7.3]EGO28812.1 hypothetical protein SERLADRAFT_459629 [Serpula lacrymans var. lacrymans S7.9]